MAEETTPGNTPKKSNPIVLYSIIGILVAALSVTGYLIYDSKGKIEEQEFKIEDLNTEIEDLESDLKDMESEIDRQDLELEEKDVLLAEKEKLLAEKQKKIDQLLSSNKINAKEAESLRAKVDQLNYYIKKYQAEVDSLRLQVETLTQEKQELAGTITNLEEKNFNVEQENRLNKTMLKAAAILKAFDFTFFRVKGTGKESEDTEFRAGRLKDLKICFKVMENTVAKAGSREVYIVLTDAKGNVFKDMSGQSGYFKDGDEDKVYTVKSTIDYNRTTVEVCQVFHKPDNVEFDKGVHRVRVFTDGFEIGSGSFLIK